MPWKILAGLARIGRKRSGRLAVFAALCAALAAASIVLPASTAQACGFTRTIHNRTGHDIYVEIRRGSVIQWTATEPIKSGGSISLEYIRMDDTILIAGPGSMRDWGTNSLGAVLDIHRCDVVRVAGESKLDGYDLKVGQPTGPDILVARKR